LVINDNVLAGLGNLSCRGLLFLLAACSDQQPVSYLAFDSDHVESTGPYSINQPIKLNFSERIAHPLRASAIEIYDSNDAKIVGYKIEAVASSIIIVGRLPLEGDYSDATFLPGHNYSVRIKGLPSLTSISSINGNYLSQDVLAEISFLSADNENVLSAFDANTQPFRVVNQNNYTAIEVPADRKLIFKFDGPVNPALNKDWGLHLAGSTDQVLFCSTRLISNDVESSTIVIDLPQFSGAGYLVLPTDLQSIGGRALPSNMRQFRVRSNN
jgi:hypothetical protein